MKITLNRTDDLEPIVIHDAVKPPWQWRTYQVIDRGIVGHLTYVPADTVNTIEIEGMAL